MPSAPHVEKHFMAGEKVRDVVIGMSDGLTVPFALAAGLSGAVASSNIVVTAGLAEIAAGAIAMGLGGGLVMVLFFSDWPRLFGRRHLGRIQGAAQALTVLASALGPLLLAWCVEWTGSYAMMFRMLAGVIAVVACAAVITPAPSPPAYTMT